MSENGRSATSVAMNEAIDMAIEGNSPYPSEATFLDSGAPYAGEALVKAGDEGRTVVLVAEDGSSRVIEPGRKIEPRQSSRSEAA